MEKQRILCHKVTALERRRNMPKTASAHSAAVDLVARFRRQRPLRGGSLIVTIFGDSLLPRGGAIALGSLIDLTAPFGLNERLVRTAASRLVKEGWIEGRRAGKLSEYRLSKNGRGLFIEATKRIYGEPESCWSGRWTLIVVPPMRAALRNEIREELIWSGFGEVSANVFAHPEFDSQALREQRSLGGLLGKVVAFEASLTEDDEPQRVVGLGWDLNDLGLRYERFVARFAGVQTQLARQHSLDPQDCFLVRTLLIHEYRRLHLRDPLLPAQLLRADWPGKQAAALCRDIYARVFGPSELHLTRVASRLAGPLPPAEPSVLLRFGGIGPVLERRDDQA
jgi:phenylacetic acid degradation operon negative regulatory protein